jgi:hypothetical protein
MKKTHKVDERYFGSRVIRCATPSGKEEAVSRMFWRKEDAEKACNELRDENPEHLYHVRHYTKLAYLVEEGDDDE